MPGLAQLIPQLANVLDTESTGSAPGGDDNSASSSGPFLGVASRSQRNSVITYYGIDRHDQWLSSHRCSNNDTTSFAHSCDRIELTDQRSVLCSGRSST